MSLTVFLVDDEAPARTRLKMLLGDILDQCPHQIVGEAENGILALSQLMKLRPALAFLDVQMPGMNGIELAGHMLQQGLETAIVFVTAFDEFALQAFDVHALDYLVKPVRATRLVQTLNRVNALQQSRVPPLVPGQGESGSAQQAVAQVAHDLHLARAHFSVQERGRVLLVPVHEVLYLRAEQKYVTLRTRERELLIEDSLVSIEEELASQFVRVHRNALVARAAIVGVERGAQEAGAPESWQVILRDVSERLPISRRQWPIIKALVK